MKKGHFLFALVALVLANILVFSCKKETSANNTQAAKIAPLLDRSAACPSITIGNGVDLIICGIDSGPSVCASPCGGSTNNSAVITTNPEVFAYTASTTFSISNYTGAARNISLSFNCATAAPQVFTIPDNTTVTFRVAPGPNGCCRAVTPC